MTIDARRASPLARCLQYRVSLGRMSPVVAFAAKEELTGYLVFDGHFIHVISLTRRDAPRKYPIVQLDGRATLASTHEEIRFVARVGPSV
jgi:hypothetical protein